MVDRTQLSVLTLNCWGLYFPSKDRRDRMAAIGRHLVDASPGYDIVGLQEVWLYEDFLLIHGLVKKSLPFARHWTSGLFGSGLVILSKYPIVSTSLRRFVLNGDPLPNLHGDWFDGKCCASTVIAHPTAGTIEVFNTHMHATYDPPGTLDVYLGSRLAQAWDMAVLLRTAKALGRHVIALGDFNSPPDSLVVQLLTRYGGVCDSWELLHPRPQNGGLKGLTAEEGAAVLGITCDTPLNSWTSHDPWINQLTGDPIGERLDYIFFDNSEEIQCMRVDVVLQDRIAGIGGPTAPLKNVSDHFAVHAVYSLSLWKPPVPQTGEQHHVRQGLSEETTEVLEQILVALEQHLLKARHKRARFAFVLTPLLVLAVLGLIAGFVWMDNMWEGREGRVVWMAFMLVGVSMLSSGWVVCMFYGWFYGGEAVSGFVNTIQEVRDALE